MDFSSQPKYPLPFFKKKPQTKPFIAGTGRKIPQLGIFWATYVPLLKEILSQQECKMPHICDQRDITKDKRNITFCTSSNYKNFTEILLSFSSKLQQPILFDQTDVGGKKSLSLSLLLFFFWHSTNTNCDSDHVLACAIQKGNIMASSAWQTNMASEKAEVYMDEGNAMIWWGEGRRANAVQMKINCIRNLKERNL